MLKPHFLAAIFSFVLCGCIQTEHKVETHHKIDPIHITVDVNLKVERELDDFFGDLDQQSSLITEDASEDARGQ
ncbi:hypothetical protein [Cerasicoccus fimbriatus]|uniref:hypothetical protein n=1 Tax=Cerasicoccus fimbriatus TaxID=3014554 RepID=UPI0022B3D4E6|nr:hypothetical protein [Cerasicoccus sp. TK19100]